MEKIMRCNANKYVQIDVFCTIDDYRDGYSNKILKRVKFTTRFIDADRIGEIAGLITDDYFHTLGKIRLLMYCELNTSIDRPIPSDKLSISYRSVNFYVNDSMIYDCCRYFEVPHKKPANTNLCKFAFLNHCRYVRKYLTVKGAPKNLNAQCGWEAGKSNSEYIWHMQNMDLILESRGSRIPKYFNAMVDMLVESEFIVDSDEDDREKFTKFCNLIKIPINTGLHSLAMNKNHRFIKCKRLKENYHKVSYCNLPFELYAIVISKLSI